jgi:hypothetical protein
MWAAGNETVPVAFGIQDDRDTTELEPYTLLGWSAESAPKNDGAS